MSSDIDSFRKKLEDQHTFPGEYIFKFIVPKGSVSKVEELWPEGETSLRESRQGNYISVTIRGVIGSSEEVISIYQKANEIEGCIAL